ncbi:ornithine carbamoyltransferase [Desulfonatronum thiosulfatophilum]|uniref:Ornithine carbamoyltransferase n=1 Tax=Desulfonatronum thiosulfatophilum TaxID=617002 RepID=A0A1G6D457_9BACT|nr:ornithine carbamoyltransferase [Desulfonatronum thiosulfatophilum]SDB39927.1 ornithine carbamoyltransferase [Desulfonatronum thiosulfatophilum]
MARNFLQITDLKRSEAWNMLTRAKEIKASNWRSTLLNGKTIILLFEKASTRTRISFEVAIRALGGNVLFMTNKESQLGRNEPLRDTARVLSRYVQGVVVRTFAQESLEELASVGTIPVINALTDLHHPCQVMSDMLTIFENTPDLPSLKVAWVGDGNNMANSWLHAAMYFPFTLHLAVPKGYEPDSGILQHARESGANVVLTHDPKEAVSEAHYVNTDVWASMGQEDAANERREIFAPFQVNSRLLALAHPECKVLHCLPAKRGEEITDNVLEGESSLVWDQAENRLHMQKALLEWVYDEHHV